MSLIVVITNDGTGTDHAASYRWEVRVNEQPIDWGTVSGHDRRDDWRKLVKRVIDAPTSRGISMNSDKLTLVDVRAMKHLRENDPGEENAKVAALCDAYLRLVRIARVAEDAIHEAIVDEDGLDAGIGSEILAALRAALPEEGDDANDR